MVTPVRTTMNDDRRRPFRRPRRQSDVPGGSVAALNRAVITPAVSSPSSKGGRDNKTGTLNLTGGAYASPLNGLPGVTQLHLNENLLTTAREYNAGLPVEQIAAATLQELHSYPIGGARRLLAALATDLHLSADKIVISHGSADLLRALFAYLLKKDDTLLLPSPGWSFYNATAALVEAQVTTYSLADRGDTFAYNREVISAQIEARQPKVVLICSPNNPTGNVFSADDFIWLVYRYPQVNFILDEAYYGFCRAYSFAQEDALLSLTDRPNVYIVRTLSKFYGLANLRVGFLVANEQNATNLNKIAPAFGLPTFNQEIAARRLFDKKYDFQMKEEYAAVNHYLYHALRRVPGFTPYQSCANFILARHDARWQRLDEALLERGYLVKRETINEANNYLRITHADMATMQHLISIIESLQEVL
jgi:histidinol-phosphate aminotransferase